MDEEGKLRSYFVEKKKKSKMSKMKKEILEIQKNLDIKVENKQK